MKYFSKASTAKLISLLFSIAVAFPALMSFTGNRHFPFYQPLEAGILSGFSSKISVSGTNTMPVIETDHGDQILTPWKSYDLKNLNEALKEHQKLTGKPVKDFLAASPELAGYLSKDLLFDMLLERPTLSVNLLAISYVFSDVFGSLPLPSDFKRRYGNSVNSNIDLFVKANLSVMKASSVGHYHLNGETKDDIFNLLKPNKTAAENVFSGLEKVRMEMHDELGFGTSYAKQGGISDLELWVGLRKRMPYMLRCKNIDLTFALCGTVPVGEKSDPDKALSFDFGREGHTLSALLAADLELKHGLFAGASFEANGGYTSTRERRVAMGREPSELSPLKAPIEIENNMSFIVSPYLKLQNFRDGFDLGLRFTYINHGEDKWRDKRINPDIPSFLNGSYIDSGNVQRKREQTAWTSKFVTLDFSYTAGNRLAIWDSHPTFFASYEHPWISKSSVRSRRLSAGVRMDF